MIHLTFSHFNSVTQPKTQEDDIKIRPKIFFLPLFHKEGITWTAASHNGHSNIVKHTHKHTHTHFLYEHISLHHRGDQPMVTGPCTVEGKAKIPLLVINGNLSKPCPTLFLVTAAVVMSPIQQGCMGGAGSTSGSSLKATQTCLWHVYTQWLTHKIGRASCRERV